MKEHTKKTRNGNHKQRHNLEKKKHKETQTYNSKHTERQTTQTTRNSAKKQYAQMNKTTQNKATT